MSFTKLNAHILSTTAILLLASTHTGGQAFASPVMTAAAEIENAVALKDDAELQKLLKKHVKNFKASEFYELFKSQEYKAFSLERKAAIMARMEEFSRTNSRIKSALRTPLANENTKILSQKAVSAPASVAPATRGGALPPAGPTRAPATRGGPVPEGPTLSFSGEETQKYAEIEVQEDVGEGYGTPYKGENAPATAVPEVTVASTPTGTPTASVAMPETEFLNQVEKEKSKLIEDFKAQQKLTKEKNRLEVKALEAKKNRDEVQKAEIEAKQQLVEQQLAELHTPKFLVTESAQANTTEIEAQAPAEQPPLAPTQADITPSPSSAPAIPEPTVQSAPATSTSSSSAPVTPPVESPLTSSTVAVESPNQLVSTLSPSSSAPVTPSSPAQSTLTPPSVTTQNSAPATRGGTIPPDGPTLSGNDLAIPQPTVGQLAASTSSNSVDPNADEKAQQLQKEAQANAALADANDHKVLHAKAAQMVNGDVQHGVTAQAYVEGFKAKLKADWGVQDDTTLWTAKYRTISTLGTQGDWSEETYRAVVGLGKMDGYAYDVPLANGSEVNFRDLPAPVQAEVLELVKREVQSTGAATANTNVSKQLEKITKTVSTNITEHNKAVAHITHPLPPATTPDHDNVAAASQEAITQQIPQANPVALTQLVPIDRNKATYGNDSELGKIAIAIAPQSTKGAWAARNSMVIDPDPVVITNPQYNDYYKLNAVRIAKLAESDPVQAELQMKSLKAEFEKKKDELWPAKAKGSLAYAFTDNVDPKEATEYLTGAEKKVETALKANVNNPADTAAHRALTAARTHALETVASHYNTVTQHSLALEKALPALKEQLNTAHGKDENYAAHQAYLKLKNAHEAFHDQHLNVSHEQAVAEKATHLQSMHQAVEGLKPHVNAKTHETLVQHVNNVQAAHDAHVGVFNHAQHTLGGIIQHDPKAPTPLRHDLPNHPPVMHTPVVHAPPQ